MPGYINSSAAAVCLLQVDELTKRSAAVAARIAQKEKDAGMDLDTLRVSLCYRLSAYVPVTSVLPRLSPPPSSPPTQPACVSWPSTHGSLSMSGRSYAAPSQIRMAVQS